jgi:catechol 2,3-dioxygenase-like lactoylglutathione lyase family enzyme/uncharacterized protein YciI
VADYYLVELARGPTWDHSRRRREQAGWDEHAAFMDGLTDEGFVVLGGPVGDEDEDALLVVHAESETAVRARLADDPWADSVLTVARVRPWSVWLRTEARPATEPIPLVEDLHHMTFLTADLDRLIAFYERIFDARVTFDREEDGVRHAFIAIGPHTVLHPFQVPGVEVPGRQSIFQRGRLDHFALNAASEEAFRELRRRLIAEGANATEGGLVTDMGSMLSFSFHDPDGGWHEVMWEKPGVPPQDGLKGASDWKLIELD